MNILGIGTAGCKIAKLFEDYPQYSVFYVGVNIKGTSCFPLPNSKTPEEAEENVPNLYLPDVEEVTVILAGASTTGGAVLRVLEQIKAAQISVIYIKPDANLLNEEEGVWQNITFRVLQEYARSGLFKNIYLVDNSIIANVVGDLSIIEYHDKINESLVNSFHMINYLKNSESVMGNIVEPKDINKIATIGIYDIENDVEKCFFELENIREKHFYFALNEKTLNKEKNLLNKISKQVKKAGQLGTTMALYDITSTTYETNFAYIATYTNFIQE